MSSKGFSIALLVILFGIIAIPSFLLIFKRSVEDRDIVQREKAQINSAANPKRTIKPKDTYEIYDPDKGKEIIALSATEEIQTFKTARVLPWKQFTVDIYPGWRLISKRDIQDGEIIGEEILIINEKDPTLVFRNSRGGHSGARCVFTEADVQRYREKEVYYPILITNYTELVDQNGNKLRREIREVSNNERRDRSNDCNVCEYSENSEGYFIPTRSYELITVPCVGPENAEIQEHIDMMLKSLKFVD